MRWRINIEKFAPSTKSEYYIDFDVELKEDKLYAKAGHSVAKFQFKLDVSNRTENVIPSLENDFTVTTSKSTIEISNDDVYVLFDKIRGCLINYIVNETEYIKEPIRLNTWRATVDNDMYKIVDWQNKYFLFAQMEQLEDIEVHQKKDRVIVKISTHYSYLSQTFGFKCEYTYEIYSNGIIRLNLNANGFRMTSFAPEFIPRVGINFATDIMFNNVSWYGLGPDESYADVNSHVFMGVYHKTADEMHEEYAMPQENGLRTGVKWLTIGCENSEIRIYSENDISFTYHDYDVKSLDRAKHIGEIEKSDKYYVNIDMKHSGVGSNSCGEEQLFRNKTGFGDYNLNLTFVPK